MYCLQYRPMQLLFQRWQKQSNITILLICYTNCTCTIIQYQSSTKVIIFLSAALHLYLLSDKFGSCCNSLLSERIILQKVLSSSYVKSVRHRVILFIVIMNPSIPNTAVLRITPFNVSGIDFDVSVFGRWYRYVRNAAVETHIFI